MHPRNLWNVLHEVASGLRIACSESASPPGTYQYRLHGEAPPRKQTLRSRCAWLKTLVPSITAKAEFDASVAKSADGVEVEVVDPDGEFSPQTFFCQEHPRDWAKENGVRGLRADPRAEFCHHLLKAAERHVCLGRTGARLDSAHLWSSIDS